MSAFNSNSSGSSWCPPACGDCECPSHCDAIVRVPMLPDPAYAQPSVLYMLPNNTLYALSNDRATWVQVNGVRSMGGCGESCGSAPCPPAPYAEEVPGVCPPVPPAPAPCPPAPAPCDCETPSVYTHTEGFPSREAVDPNTIYVLPNRGAWVLDPKKNSFMPLGNVKRVGKVPSAESAEQDMIYVLPDDKAWILDRNGSKMVPLVTDADLVERVECLPHFREAKTDTIYLMPNNTAWILNYDQTRLMEVFSEKPKISATARFKDGTPIKVLVTEQTVTVNCSCNDDHAELTCPPVRVAR